jgi:hypothetical protein
VFSSNGVVMVFSSSEVNRWSNLCKKILKEMKFDDLILKHLWNYFNFIILKFDTLKHFKLLKALQLHLTKGVE